MIWISHYFWNQTWLLCHTQQKYQIASQHAWCSLLQFWMIKMQHQTNILPSSFFFFSIHIIVFTIVVFLKCDFYRLEREKEITKKTEHNKSYYPIDWINVDYHHVHIKPPSTAVILKVHVVHSVSSMWEMPPCYSIWVSSKTCWKIHHEINIVIKVTRFSKTKILLTGSICDSFSQLFTNQMEAGNFTPHC